MGFGSIDAYAGNGNDSPATRVSRSVNVTLATSVGLTVPIPAAGRV